MIGLPLRLLGVTLAPVVAPDAQATLLALISVRVLHGSGDRGRNRLEWDAAAMKVTNLPKANDYLHYAYRKGWAL